MGSRYKKDNIVSAICKLNDDYTPETLVQMTCINLLALKMKLEQEKKSGGSAKPDPDREYVSITECIQYTY
jgi:hypothetical protein